MIGQRHRISNRHARHNRSIKAGMRMLTLLGAAFVLFAALPAGAGEVLNVNGADKLALNVNGADKVALNVSGADKLALKGYDAVGYFTDGHAQIGSKDFEYDWKGATWRFISAENRDTFAANPERYAPQYGGYSAYGISQGLVADGDPTAWTIYNAKLYLNTSESDRKQWLAAFVGYIGSANSKWPKIQSGLTP